MKAAGITLSTVGAGGGANPFLEQLAHAGRRPLLRGGEPGQHPRHLPQGDPAGLGPADRRGAVLPDPDLVVADPARPRRRACRSCSATTARPPSPPPRPCSSRPATIRSSPSGSTAWAGPWPGRRTRPAAGPRDWLGWTGVLAVLQPARGVDVPGRGDRRHRGRVRRRTAARRRSTSRASRPTARRATSTRRRPSSSGRTSTPATCTLVQIAPGVYEAPLGEIEPGRLRRPGHPDPAGLVAARADGRAGGPDRRRVPPARRRTSRSSAALRAATGGSRSSTPDRPVDPRPDRDELAFTDLWPLLLVLALLLWPLDIALRRVSVGRRELAAARGWVAGSAVDGGRAAARTATGEGLLAARERATSAETRAAMRAPVAGRRRRSRRAATTASRRQRRRR